MLPLTVALPSFVVVQQLARGGMGTVELVMRHEGMFRRLYARKRPHPELIVDELFRTMLLEEARIAGLLRHPNIVSVLDVGEDDAGPFLLMDFVDGLSVSAIIKNHAHLLPLELCLEVVAQTADGLSAAHGLRSADDQLLGLVHRDISPQNILVGFDGVARIVDFGIVKVHDSRTPATGQVLKGKLGYMSPEQLRFEPPDARSDLFSLGVVLFEMLTRTRLHGRGTATDVAGRVLRNPVPDIHELRAGLPAGVVELVFDLLAKDPALRPQTAVEVSARARRLLADLDHEERIGLKGWMTDLFSDLREQRHAERREAMRTAEQLITGVHKLPERADPEDIVVDFELADQPQANRWRWWAGAVLIALMTAFLIGRWATQTPSEQISSPAPEPEEHALGQTPETHSGPELPAPTEQARVDEDRESEAVEAVEPAVEPQRRGMRGMRSGRRGMSRMSASMDTSRTDMRGLWGWDGQ